MAAHSNPLLDLLARRGWVLTALAMALAFATHARDALRHNKHNDLFIYRAGAALGLAGRSPYDTAALRERVVEQYPDDKELAENLGFFLPPQAVVLFAPFAVLPWPAAKVAWAVVAVLLTGLAARRLPVFASAPVPPWLPPVLVVAVLLSPIVVVGMIPGQTSAPAFACVVLGEVAHRAGRRRLAGFLWAVPFVKPHIALPLLPLAWYLGGWRRAGELVLWLAGLNLAGCLICTGSPLLARDYLDYVSAGHTAVVFNRVAVNPQITSWNRLLVAAGGPVVELSAVGMLVGYAVWGLAVLARVRLAGSRPTPGWAVAVAFGGALLCCQVMGYELVFLALAVGHVLDLFAAGRVRTAGVILLGLGLAWGPFALGNVMPSHRALGTAVFAVAVLLGGWPARIMTNDPPMTKN
ncbi:MAG TPA: glycosyltransferase family 87 protein [Fimbriiglobus sp.]|nr:glycosyltransferase family 87 protein [Fimbriiglobus sp.]